MDSTVRHWSEDVFWQKALEQYYELRDSGQTSITLNINDIEAYLFDGDSPAYRLMDAMRSVSELERDDEFRGAPKLVLALLANLRRVGENRE